MKRPQIFFMLTFAIQGQGMDISLPNGQSEETKNEESLVVKIGKNQTINVTFKQPLLNNMED